MTFLKIAAVLAVLTPLAACGSGGPSGPLAYGAAAPDSHRAYPLAPPNCLKRQFPQCGSVGDGG